VAKEREISGLLPTVSGCCVFCLFSTSLYFEKTALLQQQRPKILQRRKLLAGEVFKYAALFYYLLPL